MVLFGLLSDHHLVKYNMFGAVCCGSHRFVTIINRITSNEVKNELPSCIICEVWYSIGLCKLRTVDADCLRSIYNNNQVFSHAGTSRTDSIVAIPRGRALF